jgi:hypothetical protein
VDLKPYEAIADPGSLDGLPGRPTDEVRALRATCQHLEAQVSYLRRLVQGHLDIVAAEQRRRREGGPDDLESLMAALPAALGDRVAGGTGGRFAGMSAVGDDPGITDELDAAVGDDDLGRLTALGDAGLVALADRLGALERVVSERRRVLHQRLDVLTAELTRRYRTGEASVDNVL